MKKIIVAAALIVSGMAFAEGNEKSTEKTESANSATEQHHMMDHSSHAGHHSGHHGSKMNKEDAEKTCMSEYAKDMKSCIAKKTKSM